MENKAIAIKFREIKALLLASGEANEFRVAAYSRAANQIDLLGKQLRDVYTEGGPLGVKSYLEGVKGIGDKSTAKIIEFLVSGTCKDLEDLLKKVGSVPVAVKEGTGVTRRPWSEADEIAKLVKPVVDKFFKTRSEVCGSYRRKAATCKDIDIVVAFEGKDAEPLFNEVLFHLGIGQLPDDPAIIKKGPSQTSFWYLGMQVDIWTVPEESFGAAILFATGCAEFNIQMRGWLKKHGMKLNRYCLAKADGTWLAGATEEQIFDYLGLPFIKPEQRNSWGAWADKATLRGV